MPETESLHFDRWQFQKSIAPIRPENRLSWQDLQLSMSFKTRAEVYVRRLPTPAWALNDSLLRALLVVFLEDRLAIHNPTGTLLERRAFAEKRVIEQIPKWNATIDKLQLEYVAAKRTGASQKRIKELEMEIENLDTLVRISRTGLSFVAGIVVLYYRMGRNSVEVAEELRLKPPHVRGLLWRLHQVWRKHFKLDFMLEPAVPAVPPCRSYSREEIAGMLAAGKIAIPADKPPLLPPPPEAVDLPKPAPIRRVSPPCDPNRSPKAAKIDVQRAAQLKASGLVWREVAAILGLQNCMSVRNAVTNAGLSVPSKRGRLPKDRKTPEIPAELLIAPIPTPLVGDKPSRVVGETRKERRARFISEGLCGNCGLQPRGEYAECVDCREYFAGLARARVAKKLAKD